ncbi:GNAT family N-acetyltransferase [Albimonas pacifica]|uniref:Acetyltransferase (GNAT) family protein n=1 Tax=Albimonas pacifica TaxID=1114924 RepID=A0A1I3DDA5_9RHOB|nr:GNAT family N-acetyltransferase [Albimonas pacifica]SFH84697.1 Acetyltransferase (GNAT) family protein [Albimonas pacifica]
MTNAGGITGRAGDRVSVAITWLEMGRRPDGAHPPLPMNAPVALVRAKAPPAAYFLYLYRLVGEAWEWTDRLDDDPATLAAELAREDMALHTLMWEGWPAGFFLLDWRQAGVCDLGYFGLCEATRGRGLARWLLSEAIHAGWSRPGVEKMTVNTCALDHPSALPLYQRAGFSPVRRTEVERVLTRDIG